MTGAFGRCVCGHCRSPSFSVFRDGGVVSTVRRINVILRTLIPAGGNLVPDLRLKLVF
ncbi:hypothetical protein SAMN04489764_3151 [Thermostaphylospora chromogena]|uniref:Uncharacterized protein n=1 Tax=Thermostaphylospora chromogena TaxID=35622 RepID=A0A1H1FS63_9ACTN|nr:hypothetical protein SAMN04489764_3151 [Thermostaphylospora chromogena]